eukprot:scaffold7852_cov151-Skeletonema_menzelii.AAC.14
MNNNTRKSSSPTKKRKANDGRATTDCEHDVNGNANDGGGFLSSWFGYFSGRRDEASSGLGSSPNENNMTQLNRMEEMMMRMEEKLATVSSLESRCEELERKCSSLENMLESTSKATKKHIDMKFDSLSFDLGQKCDSLAHRLEAKVESIHKHEADLALKRHEFNEMMLKNQNWEYSAAINSVDHLVYVGCTEEEAKYVAETAEELEHMTTSMRRGEWPLGSHLHEMNGNPKGIYMEMNAQLIANALRGNMTLRDLNLEGNNFTDAGDEALHLVIYDGSSLNAVADSNHTCQINGYIFSNWHENWRINRGSKIYYLLSCRNKTGSNAKHFDDLDVKILPNMLDAVQKYQNHANGHDLSIFRGAEPLSILFEIMRKWDKVFPLYKSLGEKRREVGVRELVE